MMRSYYNSPVAKRTRSQWQLFTQGACRLKRRKLDEDKKTVDKSLIDEIKQKEENDETGSKESSTSNNPDESSSDKSIEEESDGEGSKGSCKSNKRKRDEAKLVNKSLADEFEREQGNENVPVKSVKLEESWNDESEKDKSDGEANPYDSLGSKDPSKSNKLDESSRDEPKEAESDVEGFIETPSGYVKEEIEVIDVDDDSSDQNGSQGSCGSTKRKFDTAKPVDKSLADESEVEQSNKNGSQVPSKSVKLEESSADESKEDGSDGEDAESHHSSKESGEAKGIDTTELEKNTSKSQCYDSAIPFQTGTHLYIALSSDESDSDDTVLSVDDEEEGSFPEEDEDEDEDEDEPISCSSSDGDSDHMIDPFPPNKMPSHSKTSKQSPMEHEVEEVSSGSDDSQDADSESDHSGHLQPNKMTNPSQITKQSPIKTSKTESPFKIEVEEVSSGSDDTQDAISISVSESENDSDHSNYLPTNKKLNPSITNKKSPMINKEKKVRSGSANRKEKHHSVKKPKYSSNDIDTHEKTNANGKVRDPFEKSGNENGVKCQESKKGRRKDGGGSIHDILDSIIGKKDVLDKEVDDCIPLKFRFDDSEDESPSQITDDPDVERLFQEMDFELQCEEIGSYKNTTVENRDKDVDKDHDNEATHLNCERGQHGDIYFEEETGLRCRLCGVVILESRYVIPKLATYAPDRSRRSCHQHQFYSHENPNFQDTDWHPLDIYKQAKGTVWELIPINLRGCLYPHQQEGFNFLWENLAGTIELQGLQNLGPRGDGCGGGCIISHAPGTGKTLLTIVFIESFLKKFPKCCPVIIAPASMLLTWEAEFKKWQVGFSFINLYNSESLSKELNSGRSRGNKDLLRAIKMKSWCDGESVLGVSYNLYELIAGNRNKENVNVEKMGNVLLDCPGLVVLDEGHTPRNENSNIWNTLLKLKTKNRVILSGTPFQNNFRELFNTLRLVRPEAASNIVNEKVFSDMIQRRNINKSLTVSTSEDIEKLKVIISPFVHVHKGHILKSMLPGKKQSIIILNPPPFQKGFIDDLRDLSKTFEYEYKVALVSVHPSLFLCLKNEKTTYQQKLKEVRLHPDAGVKTRFVMELIRLSIPLHEKVLIFSQYTEPLNLLKDQIDIVFGWKFGREIMLIKGGVNPKVRQTIINDFNDPNSEVKVLLASIRCCSEGIHLTGASRVVLLDVVWNPSVDTQAISRAYRLGQKKVVYTYHLMVAGTTEEDKYDRQVEKGRLAEMVFSSSSMDVKESKKVQKNVIELNDKILQQMVDHQEMKGIFKRITYLEDQQEFD